MLFVVKNNGNSDNSMLINFYDSFHELYLMLHNLSLLKILIRKEFLHYAC